MDFQTLLWGRLQSRRREPNSWRIVGTMHWGRTDNWLRRQPIIEQCRQQKCDMRRDSWWGLLHGPCGKTQPITNKPDQDPIKESETGVCHLQPPDRYTTKGEIPAIKDFTVNQRKDACSRAVTTQNVMKNSEFHIDHYRCFLRASKIDGYLQYMVPVLLKERIPLTEHYPPTIARPEEWRIYVTVRKKISWQHMANDVYHTKINCSTCARDSERLHHREHS